MGREVRRVPANWEHPKDKKGHYIPLFGGSFSLLLAEYNEAAEQWLLGYQRNYDPDDPKFIPRDESTAGMTFDEWHGEIPEQEHYMPDWPEAERTHYQMYETVTEGTPISPVCDSPKTLARWLRDNKANAGAGQTATYQQWLTIIKKGGSPSFVAVINQSYQN